MNAKIQTSNDTIGLVPYKNAQPLVSVSQKAPSPLPKVDVVLPILHGTFGEDGTIQGLLELAQIPYVGSGVLGSALGMDKEVSRKLLSLAGIRTVPTLCLRRPEYEKSAQKLEAQVLEKFQFPFFVKPANAGSSVGVHKVKSREQLAPALKDAFQFDVKVLIEKGVAARELEVSVLGNDSPRASVVGEIVVSNEFYDYNTKYIDGSGVELVAPAKNLKPETAKQIQEWALLAFQTLECRGMARVDFFLDKNSGELYLNEINTIPGFTSVSMYPRMWAASGLSYPELLDELIRLAFENHKIRSGLKFTYDRDEKSEE